MSPSLCLTSQLILTQMSQTHSRRAKGSGSAQRLEHHQTESSQPEPTLISRTQKKWCWCVHILTESPRVSWTHTQPEITLVCLQSHRAAVPRVCSACCWRVTQNLWTSCSRPNQCLPPRQNDRPNKSANQPKPQQARSLSKPRAARLKSETSNPAELQKLINVPLLFSRVSS